METTNTNYQQLMLTDSGELTLEQKQFVDLHKRICYDSQKATEYIVDMAQGIREMKESKRYQTAGFASFGEYTETALGIKERQAYNYIAVIEKLPEGFVKANAAVGVTKLALLTSVNEEEREEILEKIDITQAKTTEINAAVKEALAAREEAEKQLSLLTEEKTEIEAENEKLSREYAKIAKDLKEEKARQSELAKEKAALEQKYAELETQKHTVAYQPDMQTVAELKEATEKVAASDAKIKALESQIEALKAAPKPEPTTARVEIKDDVIVRFKVKFNDFQNLLDNMSELIESMEQEQAGKCKNAVKIVFEDSIFGEATK